MCCSLYFRSESPSQNVTIMAVFADGKLGPAVIGSEDHMNMKNLPNASFSCCSRYRYHLLVDILPNKRPGYCWSDSLAFHVEKMMDAESRAEHEDRVVRQIHQEYKGQAFIINKVDKLTDMQLHYAA